MGFTVRPPMGAKTVDSTKDYVHCFLLYTYTYNKFNL